MEIMKSELKLLNLFGFKLNELEGYNKTRWSILDENNNVVGQIIRKKVHNKNKYKGTHAVFGYVTDIDSDTISCHKLTKINNNAGKGENDNPFYYEINIKRNDSIDTIKLDLGETPSLEMWSKQFGYINFSISFGKMFLNFKSKTENFNTEEVVIYEWNQNELEEDQDYEKEYYYQIGFCNKDTLLSDENSKGRTSLDLIAKYNPHFQEYGKVKIQELTWKEGKLITNIENTYQGDILEVIEKHEMGYNAINHFRYLINSILPVKQDLLSVMLEECPYLNEEGLSLLFSDIIEKRNVITEEGPNQILKKKNNNK